MQFNRADWPLSKIFVIAVIFRGINAFILRTYYNPDEYWQGPEVAHDMAFGYGHKTWEWQPTARIRGYFHPAIFAFLFRILAFFGLDSRNIIACAPYLFQSIGVAVADLFVYRLTKRLFNTTAAKWALFAHFSNWFIFYAMIRTFSNSIEAILTIVAFYYWPWIERPKIIPIPICKRLHLTGRQISLLLAASAFCIRPPNVIVWIPLGLQHLYYTHDRFQYLSREVIPIAILVITLTLFLDSYFYGVWTFVPYNFICFNVISGGSELYGINPWHYYFIEASFAMLGTFYPFFIQGCYRSGVPSLLLLILWVCFIYSFLPHKEYRFILPMLPAAMVYIGRALSMLDYSRNINDINVRENINLKVSTTPYQTNKHGSHKLKNRKLRSCMNANNTEEKTLQSKKKSKKWWTNGIIVFLIFSNFIAAMYLSAVHQRAPIVVMQHLSKLATKKSVTSIHFLMGCHSTPYYSNFHIKSNEKIQLFFLDCSPRLVQHTLQKDKKLMTLDGTQTEIFRKNPLRFMQSFYQENIYSSLSLLPNLCNDYSNEQECLFVSAGCAWVSCSTPQKSKCVALGLPFRGTVIGNMCEISNIEESSSILGVDISKEENDDDHFLSLKWLNSHIGNEENKFSTTNITYHYSASRFWTLWNETEYDELDYSLFSTCPLSTSFKSCIPSLPSHLVMWKKDAILVLPWLRHFGYNLEHRIFHSHFSEEGQYMDIYTMQNTSHILNI